MESEQLFLFETIKASQDKFFASLKAGDCKNCPVCGRHGQIYKRRLHQTVARQLIRLYRLGGAGAYVHARELLLPGVTGTGDLGKAKYWDLIEAKPHASDAKKSSGYWKLTASGAEFVAGARSISKFAHVFDDKVIGWSGPSTFIKDALGTKFNYNQLLQE